MCDDFCAFILSHGRPDKIYTLNLLKKSGYTGKYFIVIDDEDTTRERYQELFGDKVLVFSKSDIASRFDEADNFGDRRSIFYARNACFDLAKKLGCKYFIELDDDYTAFQFRVGKDLEKDYCLITCLDPVLEAMIEYYEAIPAKTIAMAQGGDFLGDSNNASWCFVQAEQLQTGQYTAAVAGGSENALAIQLPGTFFLNDSTDWDFRTPLIITPTLTNTGAATLQVTVAGRILGTFPLYKGKKVELEAGDILADVPIACLLDKTKSFFSVMNPVKVYSLGDGLVRSVNKVLPDEKGAINLTPENISAYPLAGGEVEGEVWSNIVNNFRIVSDERSTFWRFDGNALYLMFTNEGDPHGGYNALRPLIADFATGKLSTGHDFTAGGTLYAGAGACWMATDGNIYGSAWGGYLNQWVLAQINALNVALNNQITASINSNNSGWVLPNFQLKNTADLGGGWEKDSATGRIRQWGYLNAGATTGFFQVNFPITFPNTCSNVQVTVIGGGGKLADNYATAGNVTQSGFTCGQDTAGSYWEAIGW